MTPPVAYTKVPNALLEALFEATMGERRRKIILWIIRNTLGHHRPFVAAPAAKIAAECGLHRPDVTKYLGELKSHGILVIVPGHGRISASVGMAQNAAYFIEKNYGLDNPVDVAPELHQEGSVDVALELHHKNQSATSNPPKVLHLAPQSATSTPSSLKKAFKERKKERRGHTQNDYPKGTPRHTPSEEAYDLSIFLRDSVLKNDPKFRITEKQIEDWATHAQRLLSLDQRTHQEARAIIHWATSHDFWRSNILSMKKLRQKYTTLMLQMKKGGGNGQHSETTNLPPEDKYANYGKRVTPKTN